MGGPVRLWLTALLCLFTLQAQGLTYSERMALDLSAYKVTNPDAGYFDIFARRAYLLEAKPDMLRVEVSNLQMGRACRDFLELPMIDHRAVVPGFYEDPINWRAVAKPYLAFEEAMHELAAAQLVANDTYHADCLLDVLLKWAEADAFAAFHFTKLRRQAWYQIESPIFAAAMGLSTVRPFVKDRAEDLRQIEDWMLRVARRHAAIPGSDRGTCCNNHFYRRALYGAMVGVLTGDNDLFQFGVSAVFSALDGAEPDGALPLEMERGPLAAHYQNYALMYLIWIAEIAERQGYDLFSLRIGGRTLHTLVNFNMAILQDTRVLKRHASTLDQKLTYQQDDQYFAWFELYLSRFPRKDMEEVIEIRRPLYNRSAGGYTTLLYFLPKDERDASQLTD